MIGTGALQLATFRSGTKKDGEPYYMVKFHDEVSMSYVTVFVEELMYQQIQKLPKGSLCNLTYEFIPGQKSFMIQSIEVIKEK